MIRSERGIQPLWRLDTEVFDVAQALGKATNLLAAFPAQRQCIQGIEPWCVGAFNPQGGGARLAQIKLAQSCQHRFQAPIGQRHLKRHLRAVWDGRDIHQNQLVIAALGELFRAEYFSVRAHQVKQNRQQAQALSIDDNPQLQVEPVPLRRFIDVGVPVFDRTQVKAEVFIDLHFPALLAQGVQLVEREVQPGTVIDQLKQLARAFGQGFALARGDFEAQDPQLFAVEVFGFGVAFDAQNVVFVANQDVRVFLPRHVSLAVIERQRGAVLDVALHFAVARLKGAELGAGQP